MSIIEERSIPEPNTGCWLWLDGVDGSGYGRLTVDGRRVRAHRVSLIAAVGDIGALCALHRCDQPSCVNPEHLFAGTMKDNTQDMLKKGRGRHGPVRRGEDAPMAKLTPASVMEVRMLHAAGATFADIGRRYNVSYQSISNIIGGRTWRHVA